jgi:Uma2 family endonuclease
MCYSFRRDAMVTGIADAAGCGHRAGSGVVFEVLSISTARTDRITKKKEYRATPSIRRYVMLEQAAVAAAVFVRTGEDWVGHVVTGAIDLDLPEIGISVPLTELYAGLDLRSSTAG